MKKTEKNSNPPPGYEHHLGIWTKRVYSSRRHPVSLEWYINEIDGTEVHVLRHESGEFERIGPISFQLILDCLAF